MPGGPASRHSFNGRSKPQVVSGYQVAERHLHSFEVCCQRGQIGKAFSHLSLALCILPQIKEQYYSRYLDIFERWSATVEENNGFQQAMTIFEVALTRYPESPDIHHLLAKTLYRNGNIHEAWTYAVMAQKACTHDPNAQETRARLSNALVDRWHLPMLNDVNRNSVFKRAIEAAVNQGHGVVLDIGSGTGLLSMYAKQAGARAVYACEMDRFMCEMSGDILQANSDLLDIQVLSHHSNNLAVPTHIPERVSLVVSETVDAGLLGEHILPTLQHAWQNLLLPPLPAPELSPQPEQPNPIQGSGITNQDERVTCPSPALFGKVIPQKAEVYIALISCDYISRQTKLRNPNLPFFKGKRVSAKLEEPYMSEKLSQVPGGFILLSNWIPLTSINFNSLEDIEHHLSGDLGRTLEIPCIKNGVPDAIVLAFNLYLNDEEFISTNPETCTTLWENAVYPLEDLPKVTASEVVELKFSCNGIIRLSLSCENTNERDCVNLSAETLMFLNSECTVDAFLSAAKQAAVTLKKQSKARAPDPFIVCDTAPFPIAGLSLQSEFPNCKLYIEEESVQQTLKEFNIDANLCEDLEDEVDVLFIWPVTKEGTLKDGLIKKLLMYRLMMAESCYVFPQTLDLVIGLINSPTLGSMTRVDDSNTCGIKIADVINIVKTQHHLDAPLEALPHSAIIQDPIPVLRLSLSTADTEAAGCMEETRSSRLDNMLVLGGEIVQYAAEITIPEASVITGLPYWFILSGTSSATHSESTDRADSVAPQALVPEFHVPSPAITLSSRGLDSPCNQSILMLEDPLRVVGNERVTLKVNWREGVFGASVQPVQ
ncbi:protein arginine N-methyltransferase 9-like [Penaeus chinensis]|uniref:protein arginine N-methyltransferase 9-like n=1 Tax=Penaeus chinensis TaxID=139456 RepID=UPI001FB84A93|nr:protein arginine N-methyltransferase 9-like [Penaeus chinensis]XP_047493904.1 protein arginine N-methyltransferase 9-like [Penaeus chinensis]XP_047493905.1 protein arginine N-methyltransferase 9-like [Penaeus chinensis]XP_047493906.1 protein arginine N-methyltransferase 9-like [Penaeus chinensis]